MNTFEIYFTEVSGRQSWFLISRDRLESDFSTTTNDVWLSELLIESKSPLNKGIDKVPASS